MQVARIKVRKAEREHRACTRWVPGFQTAIVFGFVFKAFCLFSLEVVTLTASPRGKGIKGGFPFVTTGAQWDV